MTKHERQEKLFRAIGFVGDDLIARADEPVKTQKSNLVWGKWAALAACCALVIGLAARLVPLVGYKASSSAPETTALTMDAAPAENAEMFEEEAAAEEAPASTEAAPAGESKREGEGAQTNDASGAEACYVGALYQALLDTTLGPAKLGMPKDDVLSLLGEPKDASDEFVVCTDKGDVHYVNWRYNFTNDPDHISDVTLGFADVGDGFVLNEIMTFGTSDWALPNGLKNGSSVQQLLEAYPDAEPGINGYDGEIFAYGVEAGHVRLTFLVENDVITSISLGTYYEEPARDDKTSYEAPAYSFASSSITIYQKTASGWASHTVTGKDAKRIEVICGIEDLEPIDTLPEPAYYLDFQNGTVVMLGEDGLSGAVYACEDLDAFRDAMENGADPAAHLTLLDKGKFPLGTDDVIKQAAAK